MEKDTMKTLIISDTHLFNVFEEKKYKYLYNLFSSVDGIILNGDFWDGYLTSFDEFINSAWSDLFPVLKQKGAIYIYGNHDKKTMSDSRVKLFSQEQLDAYDVAINGISFHFEHGHKIVPSIDHYLPIISKSRLFMRTSQFAKRIGVKLLKKRMYQNEVFTNRIMRKWKKLNLAEDSYLVCGHTHFSEHNKEILFLNTGFNEFGMGQYAIIEDTAVSLMDERF